MNKFGFIVGITAATALVGCIDPDWQARQHAKKATSRPGRTVETSAPVTPVADNYNVTSVEPTAAVHTVDVDDVTTPGAGDLTPIVINDATPTATTPVATTPAVPETTTYIIQSGDSISKISKRYNIKVDAIKAANPGLTDVNKIRIGQKIQLPGKVDVGAQTVPAAATTTVKTTAKPYVPYTGATQDYVVQKGDYLGKIAKKFGCSTRQLKELNGMSTDTVVLGKKMKVPASAAVEQPAATTTEPKVKDEPKVVESNEAAASVDAAEDTPANNVADAVVTPDPAPIATAADYDVYEVKDGEDITSISINFDVAPAEIRQLNNLEDGAVLSPGTKLKLPAGTVQ